MKIALSLDAKQPEGRSVWTRIGRGCRAGDEVLFRSGVAAGVHSVGEYIL